MSGAWIKVEHITPDKPEVIRMAKLLRIDQDTVVGKLIRIWIWADQQLVSGNAIPVTDQSLDRLTSRSGFASALRAVGWLSGREGLLTIPNFERHNGQTAKARAVTYRRVIRHRNARDDCNDPPVTESLPDKRLEEEKKDKAINRLRNRSVDGVSVGGTAHAGDEDDFMLLVLQLVGKPDMSANGGLWRTLFRQNPSKGWRVMNDLRETLKDRPDEIRTTPAQFAMDLWKRFQ